MFLKKRRALKPQIPPIFKSQKNWKKKFQFNQFQFSSRGIYGYFSKFC